MPRWFRALVVVALSLGGCGDSTSRPTGDGGSASDAGEVVDATAEADVSSSDAGATDATFDADGLDATFDAGATDATFDADGADATEADACAAEEVCNGADDDCDGAVDEGAPEELCSGSGERCVYGECVAGMGTLVWSETLPGSYGSTGLDVIVDGADQPIVAAYLTGSASDVGTGPLDPGNSLLASVRGADGAARWAVRGGAPGTSDDMPFVVARASDGTLYLGGTISSAGAFGDSTLTPTGGGDGYVAQFDSSGVPTRAWLVGSDTGAEVSDIAFTAAEDLVVVGSFSGTITHDSTTLVAEGSEVFVARFDAAGAPLGAFAFGGAGSADGLAISIAPDGDYFVGGEFVSSMTIGATTYEAAGVRDGFLARVSPTGTVRWSHHVGTVGFDATTSVVTTAAGGVCAAGEFGRTFDFGLGDETAADNRDGFVACYDGDGAILWAESVGGSRGSPVRGMAADAEGNLFVAGSAHPATSPGYADPYAASFTPDGFRRWSRIISTPTTSDYASAIAVGTDRQVYVVGGSQPIRVWRFGD